MSAKKSNNISRRKFLKLLGGSLAGTFLLPHLTSCSNFLEKKLSFSGEIKGEENIVGHLLRDAKLNFPTKETEEYIYDVIIAGGGPSGLAAAWKLTKSGMNNYLIIDKETDFGGLCRGMEEDDLEFCCGAHYANYPEPHQKHLIELYTDCEVIESIGKDGWANIKDKFLLKNPEHNLFAGNRWENVEFPFQIATKKDVEDYDKFHEEVDYWNSWKDDKNRNAIGTPVDKISENKKVRDLDKISIAEYLKQINLTSKLLKWYVNIWMIDEYSSTIENTSAWAAFLFFRSVPFPEHRKGTVGLITWEKGLGYMSEKMAKLIPKKNKITSNYVVNIEQKKELVFTTIYDYKNKKYRCLKSKDVVFAIPKFQVYNIIPQLKKAGRNEFEGMKYSAWMIGIIHVKHLPDFKGGKIAWENTIFDSWTMGFVNNHHQINRSSDKKHILSFYACFPYSPKKERYELLSYGWQHWAKVILNELEKAFPDIEKSIEKIDIWKWGHAMRQPEVGTVFGEKRKKMQESFGNIHFAQVDIAGVPIWEEATYIGIKAAEKILSKQKIKFKSSIF